jgi:arsenate reductase
MHRRTDAGHRRQKEDRFEENDGCAQITVLQRRRMLCRLLRPRRVRGLLLLLTTVVFACVANAGRSQMAAAFFNQLADPRRARALSAGTRPGAHVHPEVIIVMRESGLDLSQARPSLLTRALASRADVLITMGCGDECPVIPGARRDDWPLPDPKDQPVERVREMRDEIRRRVAAFVTAENWAL